MSATETEATNLSLLLKKVRVNKMPDNILMGLYEAIQHHRFNVN